MDISNENHFGLFSLNSAIFNSEDGGSSLSESSIFNSFRIIPNISLHDGNNPLTDSNNVPLLTSQHRYLSILFGTAGDQHACYLYNSSKIYRINRKLFTIIIIDRMLLLILQNVLLSQTLQCSY